MSVVLGTHKTVTAGVSPGAVPSATLVQTGLGAKLRIDLGREVLLIALGNDPRASLQALRDDVARLLKGDTS